MRTTLSPLPLTAFEEYMLRDDRPAYPMNIVARLRLTGPLDRRAATAAWERTVARHPLLRATVSGCGERRPEWAAVDNLPPLRWDGDAAHGRLPAMWPINLTREPALRGWAAADSRQSTIVLQVHHAAYDGKAVLQVADDFLRSYAQAIDGDREGIGLPPSDEALLQRRGTFGLSAAKLLKMLPGQLSGLVGAAKFLFRRPVPLLANDYATERRLEGRVPEALPAVRTGRLDAVDLWRLSAAAADQQVTVNDWLLRDFFLAVDEFRRRHGTPDSRDWIRFSVPMNLRRARDAGLPAANVVSMVFLDRNAKQIADSTPLLRGIHAEMDLIRCRQLDLTFIWSLCALRALPGGLAGRVGNGRCEATCVVSNLGRALADSPLPRRGGKLVAGNLLLEGLDFFVPLREGTAASVALVFYSGELRICLHYDSRRITSVQADDLLATYLQTIRASIGAVVPAKHGLAA